jgi:hypothetical protein
MALDDPTALETRLTTAIGEAARHALEDAQARHEAAWAAAIGDEAARRSGRASGRAPAPPRPAPEVSITPDAPLADAWARASYFAQLGVARTAEPDVIAAAHAARDAALRAAGAPLAWRRELERAAMALADPGLAAAYAATAPDDDPATLAALARAWPTPRR